MRKALDGFLNPMKSRYSLAIGLLKRFGADQEALYDLQNDEEQKKDVAQSVWLDEDG